MADLLDARLGLPVLLPELPDSPRSPYDSATMSAVPPSATNVAIAPAARQTKSAECALTTSMRLDTGEPPRVHDRHRTDLVLAEPLLEKRVSHERETVLDGWVGRLAEIGREDVALRTRRADGCKRLLPRDLAGVDRGEAPFQQRTLVGKLDLLVDRDPLRRVIRVRDDDMLTPAASAASTTEWISARPRWPVASTSPCRATTPRTAASATGVTETGSPPTPSAANSSWITRQTGCFAGLGPSSLASFSESTVGSQTIRAPPRAAISTACAFSPPTPAFSVIAPRASTPGTAARTTAARSAVGT